jgi:hypothetical protein
MDLLTVTLHDKTVLTFASDSGNDQLLSMADAKLPILTWRGIPIVVH